MDQQNYRLLPLNTIIKAWCLPAVHCSQNLDLQSQDYDYEDNLELVICTWREGFHSFFQNWFLSVVLTPLQEQIALMFDSLWLVLCTNIFCYCFFSSFISIYFYLINLKWIQTVELCIVFICIRLFHSCVIMNDSNLSYF